MKLYDYPKSGNGYKVRLLLGHLNQSYEYISLDILRGETRTERFLRKNPNGRIPLLELDDETFLPESNAILFFLAQGQGTGPARRLSKRKPCNGCSLSNIAMSLISPRRVSGYPLKVWKIRHLII